MLVSHLDDAPFGKATAKGNVKSQRSRGDAFPAGDKGSHHVLSRQVAISASQALSSRLHLYRAFYQRRGLHEQGHEACKAGSRATHTLLAALFPSCMMLPLPKRAFMSFITASSALACNCESQHEAAVQTGPGNDCISLLTSGKASLGAGHTF